MDRISAWLCALLLAGCASQNEVAKRDRPDEAPRTAGGELRTPGAGGEGPAPLADPHRDGNRIASSLHAITAVVDAISDAKPIAPDEAAEGGAPSARDSAPSDRLPAEQGTRESRRTK